MEQDNIKLLSLNIKESKILEERKLIEESDNKLTQELFGVINNSISNNIPSIKIIQPVTPQKILKVVTTTNNNNNNTNNNNPYISNKIKR